MWLLRLLPWCFIVSLASAADCNWKMPPDKDENGKIIHECTQIIRWKHRDDKEATSTCLEYFPTTFLKGESVDKATKTDIKCTVYRQFECNHVDGVSFSMFDKCYKFTDKEKTIEEYLAQRDTICDKEGALPVFFTMSQGKHIAIEAHKQGIEKIWVNLDKDGKTIDAPTDKESKRVEKGFLLYKNLWKVHDEVYWNGDNLKITEKDTQEGPNKGKPKLPPNVKHLFFRSRTDYVHNLYQGSFERVLENSGTKARVVCEYPAKIVPNQKSYCEKMGDKGLGLNAIYDDRNNRKRCLYTTLSKFSLKGTKEAIRDFTGCKENPSNQHTAGLDDGTAAASKYATLTKDGTYRLAAIKVNAKIEKSDSMARYGQSVRKHCDTKSYSDAEIQIQRSPYQIYSHPVSDSVKADFSRLITSKWLNGYPKDECSDFPEGDMDSNTLAIHKGGIIDVPVPIRLSAICSIESNVDCTLHKGLCNDADGRARPDKKCTNTAEWNKDTKLYAKCGCIRHHGKNGDQCDWEGPDDSCGVFHDVRANEDVKKRDPMPAGQQEWDDKVPLGFKTIQRTSDYVDKAVVRKGCIMEIWSHPVEDTSIVNFPLLLNLGVGEYDVPNDDAGTLNGWAKGMAASAAKCSCPTKDRLP